MGSQPWLRLGDKQKQRHRTVTPKQPSFNTFVINSLGPCSRQWAPAQSNLHRHLQPVERCVSFLILQHCPPFCSLSVAGHTNRCPPFLKCAIDGRTAGSDEGPAEEAGTSGRGPEVQVPLKLRLTGSPNGKPDVQLQLFSLKFGEAACRPSRKSSRTQQPPHLSGAPALTCSLFLISTHL